MTKVVSIGRYPPYSLLKHLREKGRVYDPQGLSPTMLAAMGGGGGNVPAVICIEEYEKKKQ